MGDQSQMGTFCSVLGAKAFGPKWRILGPGDCRAAVQEETENKSFFYLEDEAKPSLFNGGVFLSALEFRSREANLCSFLQDGSQKISLYICLLN